MTGPVARFVKGMELLSEPLDFPVGTTPSETVFTEDRMKLIHYAPRVKECYPTPILIVYALVNRYYILDLQPDKSVIRKLLDEGFDVYVIDWGYPRGPDRYLDLDDYVNGYVDTSVDEVRKRSGADKITLLGVCQGGTFSVMYASLHPEKLKNLITMVSPVDFDTDRGLLNLWAKSLDVDKVVDHYGMVPGDFLNSGFLLTDPVRLTIDKYAGIFGRIEFGSDEHAVRSKNEEMLRNFMRMEKWIFDSPDQAGEAFRQFMKDCYQRNLLIKNKMEIGGHRIDLKKISMPLLNVMAEFDHLVPNETSRPLNAAVSSEDKEVQVFRTGHIGIFVGAKSQKEVCPKIAEWLRPRSHLPSGAARKSQLQRRGA